MPLVVVVEVLEQLLPGDFLAAFHHPRHARVFQFDGVIDPALAPEGKLDGRALHLDVAVAHGRQAIVFVGLGVLLVSDPN